MAGTPKTEPFGLMVSKRLKLAWEEKRLEDEEHWGNNRLAKRAGVSKSQVSDILTGKSKNPSFWAVWRLAEELGVSVEWLVTGKGDRWRAGHPPPSETMIRAAAG